VGIWKNDEMIAVAGGDPTNVGSSNKGVALVITHVNQGDQVYCKREMGDTYLEDSLMTTFSGALITPD
jgi:dihydroxyacetone kinase DhaKLM complex PTS-EIIA-like component DhaM